MDEHGIDRHAIELPVLACGATICKVQGLVPKDEMLFQPPNPKSTSISMQSILLPINIRGCQGGFTEYFEGKFGIRKIGGNKRAASMTQERRREIALKAARSRWDRSEQKG